MSGFLGFHLLYVEILPYYLGCEITCIALYTHNHTNKISINPYTYIWYNINLQNKKRHIKTQTPWINRHASKYKNTYEHQYNKKHTSTKPYRQ